MTRGSTWTPNWNNYGEIVLCLNGKKITFEVDSSIAYGIYIKADSCSLTITDCNSNPGSISSQYGNVKSFVRIDYGTFNLYNGKIVATKERTEAMSYYGGGVNVDNRFSTFNMYGGEISGHKLSDSGTTTSSYGGGVYNNGTFNMYGGKITGNTARSSGGGVYNGGSFNMYGGEITGNSSGDGGGVYNDGGGTVNISGTTATISGNTANRYGGGVYNNRSGSSGSYSYSSLTMSGGSITNNEASGYQGGGIFSNFGCPVTLSGSVSITDNKVTGTANNNNGGGIFCMSGATLTLSGSVQITDNKKGDADNNLYLVSNQSINGSNLDTDARIGITAFENQTVVTGSTNTTIFTSDSDSYKLTVDDSGLKLVANLPPHNHCVCGGNSTVGCNHTAITDWTEWGSATSLPTTTGKYYLTTDVTISSTWKPKDLTVLCLNGYTITCTTNVSAIEPLSWFTLTDCSANKIGTITHSVSGYASTGIKLSSGTFTMYGGKITGNKNTNAGGAAGVYVGGSSIFKMYGGSISGNTGRGVYVNAALGVGTATFYMYGGYISGNNNPESYGGGVCNKGIFEMRGGTISENTATVGGGVYNNAVNGLASGRTGVFTMSGGEISGNTATDSSGGGIYNNLGTFTMSGGTIGGANAAAGNNAQYGGGIYNSNGSCKIYNSATISYNTATSGGGVYEAVNGDLGERKITMSGGTISNNTATKNGGGVYIEPRRLISGTYSAYYSAYFDMTGGTIKDNSAKEYGGGVCNSGAFTMSGNAVISGNTATSGGGVYAQNGTVTLKGTAKITDNARGSTGTATANNLYLPNNMTVTANELSEGANIGVTTATTPISGSPIVITNGSASTNHFSSDNSAYEIDEADEKVVLKLASAQHTHSLSWQNDDTQHWQVCSDSSCDYETTRENHTWNNGEITTQPSTTATGVKTFTCTTCNKTRTEAIAKLDTPVGIPTGGSYTYDGNAHTGVETNDGYRISGTNSATNANSYTVTLTLNSGYKWSDDTTATKDITWSIAKANKDAPGGLAAVSPGSAGANDGRITGVTSEMEYKAAGADTWTTCTGTEITGLSAGSYEVRYKVTANYNASSAFTVTVSDGAVPVYALTVTDGSGSGSYAANTSVTVTANAPASYMIFDKWVVRSGSVTVTDESSATTTVTTGAGAATIEATYKHEHSWNTAWSSNETQHWHNCLAPDCDVKQGLSAHEWNSGAVTTQPTTTATGVKTFICTVCEVIKTETIPMLPSIINGNGATAKQGEAKALSFTSSADRSTFSHVELDGTTLAATYYTVTSGSTVVTLNADFVATLAAGGHTLAIVSSNGTATANFTIQAASPTPDDPDTKPDTKPDDEAKPDDGKKADTKPDGKSDGAKQPPRTGDESNAALWLLLLVGSGASMATLGKKKRYSK